MQTFGILNRAMATRWGQYLHHIADELYTLRPEGQVVSIHGEPGRRCRRFDYLTDARFAGQYNDNRFFHRRGDLNGRAREANDSSTKPSYPVR